MSTELAENKTTALMSPTEINAALHIVFPNLLKTEYELGMKVANEFGLNPLKREIYLVGYGEGQYRKLSIIIGYEVFLKRAERIGTLDGWKCETVVEDEDLVARVTIHRKDRSMPFVWDVCLREYEQKDKNGNPNKMWAEKPRTMLKKVCIAQAFRICFPEELGGLPYIADEVPQQMQPSAAVIAPTQEVNPGPQQDPAVSFSIQKAKELGASDEVISEILGTDDWENVSLDGMKKLNNVILKKIEANERRA